MATQSAGIFSILLQNIALLWEKNRWLFVRYVAVWVILFVVSVILYANPPLGPLQSYSKIIGGAVLAFLTSTTIAILNRMNILTPVERQLQASLEQVGKQVEKIEGIIEADSLDFKRKSESIYAYGKYLRVHHRFGFNDIRGTMHDTFDREDLLRHALTLTPDGGMFRYMISFIGNAPAFNDLVRTAIARGVSIRLMLMMPTENTEVLKARFRDCFGNLEYPSLAHFANMLRPHAELIIAERNFQNENRKSRDGSFEVEFFTQSLNFPLMIASPGSQSKLDQQSLEVAFTGFYAGRNAEKMPYIEWRGGEFGIIGDFKDLFDRKWKACSKLKEIEAPTK